MREMVETERMTEGSNPAGVASQNPENHRVFGNDPPATPPKLTPDSQNVGGGSGGAGPAGTGETAALHRCGETWAAAEGRPESCGALISAGAALGCSVCAGNRCYEHCGSVDHFGGDLYVEGGANGFSWRVRR